MEGVVVSAKRLELDGKLAGLLCFENPTGFHAEDWRGDQEKAASVLGIVLCLERIFETKRLIGLIEIYESRLGDAKQ